MLYLVVDCLVRLVLCLTILICAISLGFVWIRNIRVQTLLRFNSANARVVRCKRKRLTHSPFHACLNITHLVSMLSSFFMLKSSARLLINHCTSRLSKTLFYFVATQTTARMQHVRMYVLDSFMLVKFYPYIHSSTRFEH